MYLQMTGWSRLQDYTFLDGLKRRNGPTADVMWAKLRHGVHSGVPGGVGMGGIGVNEWNLHDSVHKHQQRAAIDAVKGVKVPLMPYLCCSLHKSYQSWRCPGVAENARQWQDVRPRTQPVRP